ncbi:hypothetical protein IAI10_05760 [Clostridium sp. 19966]|uniref:TcaA NTF2-like domain-containing protein n=1 Tax=Clostridium sp. 19966 TaxID=2768166 RepID=UPI0028DEFC7A|nr:hypothetical protein [Clostridium sp. 19966]MDT8716154.1 hypothetical protein [Clostridium sp. 19966]
MKKKVIFIGIIVVIIVSVSAIIGIKGISTSRKTSNNSSISQSINKTNEDTSSKNSADKGSETSNENSSDTSNNGNSSNTSSDQSANSSNAALNSNTNTNSQTNAAEYSKYAEEVVTNFSNLYSAAINNSDMNTSILDNVLLPNSVAYNEVKQEVQNYKKKNANVNFEDFEINNIKEKAADDYEVTVNQILAITENGGTSKQENKVIYKVKIAKNKVGIYEIIKE